VTVGVRDGMGSVFKRNRRGATVGAEMDGRDGPGRIGQVVVADQPPPDSWAAWAGFAFKTRGSVRTWWMGGSFEF
jgi:hypothetical protein